MTPRVLSVALLAMLLASAAAGDEPNKPPDEGKAAGADVLDLLFFAEKRPVFLRLHVQVDGRSYEAVWLEAIRRLHKYMDSDGDGRLSSPEKARGSLLQQLQIRDRQQARRAAAMPAASPAANNTDHVSTADDLAEYLRSSFGPAQLQIAGPESTGPESLFVALDTDGDKRLTRAEVEAAEASLRKLDQDDDGTIQLQEMQPFRNPYFGRSTVRNQPDADGAAFVLISPHESRTKLVRRLVSRYDRPELDSKLSREELGMEPSRFEQADGDGDGALDTDELVRLLSGVAPDLELDVRLAGSGSARIAVTQSGPAPSAAGLETRGNASGGLDLVLDGILLELNAGGRGAGFPNTRQFFQQQFRQADGDNNKYLDAKEAQQNGVFDTATFKLMDRDGDGKLFEKEMDDYIAQDEDTAQSRTMVSALDQGRSLFDVLDANRDRRLTVREIREVVAKLAAWDRDGDGQVTAEEVPRHYRLGFGRGRSALMSRFFGDAAQFIVATSGMPGAVSKGPAWFTKMDRNRDGDLSRREFLGSLAEFNRLDADHNGLLDPGEANKAR